MKIYKDGEREEFSIQSRLLLFATHSEGEVREAKLGGNSIEKLRS